jgi:DNA-damage-inducible protein J
MRILYTKEAYLPLSWSIKKKGGEDMSSHVSMNIRMDSEIKQQAQALFSNLGMDMTTAINIFLRQAILHEGLPFPVKRATLNKETIAAIEDVENGRNLSPVFNSIEDAKRWLNA